METMTECKWRQEGPEEVGAGLSLAWPSWSSIQKVQGSRQVADLMQTHSLVLLNGDRDHEHLRASCSLVCGYKTP